MQQIEAEVTALNAEVTRLRMMVERCVDFQQQQQQQRGPAGPMPSGGYVDPRIGAVPPMPLPGQPLAVLPVLFSGMEGTARLFRVLMETYPWLTPPEVREAAEIVKNEKALAAEERRRRAERRKQKLQSSDSDENDDGVIGATDRPPLGKKSGTTQINYQNIAPAAAAATAAASDPTPLPVDDPERPAISPFLSGGAPVVTSALGTPRTVSPLPKKMPVGPVGDGVLLNRRPSGKVNVQRIKAFGAEDNSDDSSDNGLRGSASAAVVPALDSRVPEDEHDF